ncbi:UAA transporter [Athelia psychrophila]|uniref:UAA transporter n=1 Tax=Athelia psychrophila TaxID=1759441 RepID=A0A166KBD2_9AGAM|nr:UAA transporter [Fibularhizoctonia sp. CBS 109695]
MSDWIATLGLIFGGCCSNALSLEQITSKYPDSGTLITFFQFLLISLHGLPRHLEFSDGRIPYPRLKARKIPLTPYLVQVALFYLVSLLNNVAFGYKIPMPVHIIFRSGGLIVSMLLGYLITGKRYTIVQVASVFVVTAGVAVTTLSASRPSSKASAAPTSGSPLQFNATYATGIAILSVALIFAGLLGLVQDWTYSRYRAPKPANGTASQSTVKNSSEAPDWQESLFYLHFLALPMFLSVREDLVAQFHAIHAGPKFVLPLSFSALYQAYPTLSYPLVANSAFATPSDALMIPIAYLPLLLNTLTQLLCSAGVHRLTGKVSSLTVTLTLVVRKAVSLIISVLLYGGDGKGNMKMWAGAVLVLSGTIGYSLGGKAAPRKAVAVGGANGKAKKD